MSTHISSLRHDLRAQLINVKGFCEEIEHSAGEIEAIRGADRRLHSEDIEKILKVLSEDLLPCVKYLSLSAEQLDNVIMSIRFSNRQIEQ